jgi:hypothetical protein
LLLIEIAALVVVVAVAVVIALGIVAAHALALPDTGQGKEG